MNERIGFFGIVLTTLVLTASIATTAKADDDTIRIGELSSYARYAAFNVPYRNGWQMALAEINTAGGVLGKPLEIISRDDGGTAGTAVRVASELLLREKVSLIFGTFLSGTALTVSDYANQNKIVFLATTPLTDALTLGSGNRHTFRLRPNTYMQTAMLVDAVETSGITKWAIVAPNYAYGQSAAASFKQLIMAAIPGIEIVAEQYPPLGRIDASATIAAIAQAEPEGVFSALFGGDLVAFTREGNAQNLFEDRTILSLLTGEPEWLLNLGRNTPEGWIVTGYPWAQIDSPPHIAFVENYRTAFNDTPRLGSLLGYTAVYAIKAAIEAAGSIETEALIDTFEGLRFDTLVGRTEFRAIDHQATFGAWVGTLDVERGNGVMRNWSYKDGARFMTPEGDVRARRPQ